LASFGNRSGRICLFALWLRAGWAMRETFELVGRFGVQMVVGAVLFAAVAIVAYLLWLLTEFLRQHGAPTHIYLGSWFVAELLFLLDVLCFMIFALAEAFKLVREIWRKL
jgi:hypothetical protein